MPDKDGVTHSPLTERDLPRIVIEGVSFPSLKRVSLSIFAKGSLGFGSLGVPSTRDHLPIVLSHPTMLFKTQIIDSRTLTPAPIVTPVPIETLGPNSVGSILAVG
uniref:Uncharacterized protein n=1 Tax=Cyprinodon variegatus TaxID=28743 RepID=A0A3Q2CH11_CYPVA